MRKLKKELNHLETSDDVVKKLRNDIDDAKISLSAGILTTKESMTISNEAKDPFTLEAVESLNKKHPNHVVIREN
jgi:hypothetical protein